MASQPKQKESTDLRAAGAELGQQTGRNLVFLLQIKASKLMDDGARQK